MPDAGPHHGALASGAAVSAWTTRADLDLAGAPPPGPLVAVPTGVLLAVLAAAAGVAVVSGAFAHLRVVRAKPGEVLRVA